MINNQFNIITNINVITSENKTILYLLGATGIVLTLVLSYYSIIPIILFFFYSLSGESKKSILIWWVIVTLLTLVGELNQLLRLIIQITDILILVYLFIFKFGFKISAYPKIPTSMLTFLIFYYFTLVMSTLMSNYPAAGMMMIVRQSVFFVIVYLLFALIEDEKDIKVIFSALLFSSFVMASSTIYSFIVYSGSFFDLSAGIRGRIAGIITNPNNISNYYLVSFPLLFISILKNKSFISSRIAKFLIFYFSFALIITLSRSAILGIFVSSAILLYILRKKSFYRIASFVMLVLLVIIFNDSIQNILSFIFRIERGVTGRDYLWDLSINIIKDNPIFGLGPGAYKYEAFNYFPLLFTSWTGEMLIKTFTEANGVNLSHNFFLFLFSELGVLGLVAAIYIVIIFLSFSKIVKFINDKTSNSYYLVVALLCIGISEFVRAMFESIGILFFGVISSDLPFWLVFISLSFLINKHRKKYYSTLNY